MYLLHVIWILIWVCTIQFSQQRAIDQVIEDVEIDYKKSLKDDELVSKLPSKVWHDYALEGRTEELVKLQLDMIMTRDQYRDTVNSTADLPGRRRRNAIKDKTRLWPRRIPYRFKEGFDIEDKYKVVMAMNHWEENTCLEFVEARGTDFDVIEYARSDDACESIVGRAQGPQPLNLAKPCMYKEILLHEIGHALGLYHEHMRADRDEFVTINYKNIQEDRDIEFDKLFTDSYKDFNKPYDYESIMHYGKLFFSKNRTAKLVTIEPKDPKYIDIIGEVTSLSFYDVKIVNEMYKCSEGCAEKYCPDEGFLGKNCQCYCMGNTTQDVVSCDPKTSCGKLDIDLKIFNVYNRDFQPFRLNRELYPDGTIVLVDFKDEACGDDLTNYTCVRDDWIGKLPECVREADCVFDGVNDGIILKYISGLALKLGDEISSREQVRVTCKADAAKLKDGNEFLECFNGTWDREISSISCITEHPLCPMVLYATLSGTFESGIEVNCLNGFELEGNTKWFFCQWNGSWTPHQPVCKPARCKLPQQNDQRIFYDSQGTKLPGGSYVPHGSITSMWCPQGHIPDDLELSCSYGELDPDLIPQCSLVTCPQPPVDNVEFLPKKDSYIYGDVVEIKHCDWKLEFVGSRRLQCKKDGKWSDKAQCRTFCEKDIVKFENIEHTAYKSSVWKRTKGVGSFQACERSCLEWERFLCRAFVFGYENGQRWCYIYPYSPEEYPELLEEKMFWTVGVRKCVPRK